MFRLCIMLLLTVGMYSGLWSAGFVWDDIPLIVQNQALVDGSVRSFFTDDLWAESGAGDVSSGYFRPLVLLSFAFDRWMFDLEPLGYHIHSLVWHLIAVVVGHYHLQEDHNFHHLFYHQYHHHHHH